jgi:hypothetical protein
LGALVNDKLNIEKLEKKIEKLEKDINKLCNKDETFTQIENNCKNIFQKAIKMKLLRRLRTIVKIFSKKKKCKQLVICSKCCAMR